MSPQEERRSGGDDDSAATPKLCPACGSRYPVDALFCPSDGTPLQLASHSSGPDVDPYLGKEILGHIEIRQLAGIGAMGRVYRAFQKGIDRDVAVKILHRELSANQQLVARFHREAKVASRLQHTNVVHAYLTGQLPDGSMYIVMEYLDGLSLQSALAAAGGAFPLSRALHVALQLCDAAGEGHAQGIIHRDIKPENVMLVRRGDDDDFVKVLDFGIARFNWGEQSMATAAGLIFGTARYISPEGAQGEQVGPQSDVYSIATLVYQMLSGRTPFEGESAVALLVSQIHDPPPPLKSIPRAAYVPGPIADVIMKNLSKSAAARAPDARALGRQLVEAAKASGLSPEELLARGTLLAGRPSAPMQIAPLQRTRQMTLDPETQERLGGPRSGKATTPEEHVPASRLLPGAATTKWTPPPGFQAKLDPHSGNVPGAFPPPSAARPPMASVDPTLDDDDGTPLPASAMPASPLAHSPVPPPSQEAPFSRTVPAPPLVAEVAPPPSYQRPKSSVDSIGGDVEKVRLPGRARAFAIILLCFLLGVFGAGAIAVKAGLVGGPQRPTLEAEVSRATDALMHQRWDAPAGNNVVDITNEGLSLYPNDPQLLHVRQLACDEVMKVAKQQHRDGDLAESLRMTKLAHELDPSDDDANRHLSEYQADVDKGQARLPPSEPSAAPSGSAAAPPFAALEVPAASPKVGQAVDLVAKVGVHTKGAPKIEAAEFVIAGPGAPGISVAAQMEKSGALHAHYTFTAPGKYMVTFSARANGSIVSATKAIEVTGAALAPIAPTASHASPPQASSAPASSTTAPAAIDQPPGPAPTATASGKWL